MRFVTIRHEALCTFAFVLFSSHGFTQSVEDSEYVQERIEVHTVTAAPEEDVLSDYKGIDWLIRDVKKGELSAYGPDFEKNDADAISAIQRFDRPAIGGKAIEPYFTKMCRELSAGTSDVISLAAIFSEAEMAEKTAIAQAYGEIEALLSTDGKTAVITMLKESQVQLSQEEMAEIRERARAQLDIEGLSSTSSQTADALAARESKGLQKLDYVGLAADVPGYTYDLLTKACQRHEEITKSDGRSSRNLGIVDDSNSEFPSQKSGPFIRSSKPFHQADQE